MYGLANAHRESNPKTSKNGKIYIMGLVYGNFYELDKKTGALKDGALKFLKKKQKAVVDGRQRILR